ncbi:hypothetical protein WN55_03759 [Dufourea novaeangliae]|uniref:Uncharacterized protein n=1 Tax=Dufourea novaeangliae TaxID=178035 RepID=A0A154PK75_DUFNO|nr:hypothetical protein WN55_03759 [Dufourea novaeangliae]
MGIGRTKGLKGGGRDTVGIPFARKTPSPPSPSLHGYLERKRDPAGQRSPAPIDSTLRLSYMPIQMSPWEPGATLLRKSYPFRYPKLLFNALHVKKPRPLAQATMSQPPTNLQILRPNDHVTCDPGSQLELLYPRGEQATGGESLTDSSAIISGLASRGPIVPSLAGRCEEFVNPACRFSRAAERALRTIVRAWKHTRGAPGVMGTNPPLRPGRNDEPHTGTLHSGQ